MAYTTAIATTKANVEALITALTGTETIDELLIISKAATGLNCFNYNVLETAIETLIDTQTSSTAHEDILLASVLLNQTQARTYSYYDEQVVQTSNAAYPVPANAVACFVSCTAAGDSWVDGSNQYGGAGYIVDYEIGVSAGGTINVIVASGSSGASHTIGNLIVHGGGQYNANKGKVFDAGVEQPINGVTVFKNPNTSAGYSIPTSDITLKFEIVTVV